MITASAASDTAIVEAARNVGWSAAEIATLAHVAEALVPGAGDGGVRRAATAAEALVRAADPAQVRQIRLVLRAVEWSLGNLLLGGPARPFSALDHAARERQLKSWSTSRLALRRALFQGLKKLIAFIAYADPTAPDGGPNPLLTGIGYSQDDRPLTAQRTPIRPLALPFTATPPGESIRLDADLVVVGSGAGGGVVAAECAAAGRSVVVVEAGPFVAEASMPADELGAFSRLYLNHGLLSTWDASVTIVAGSGVGGGTLINWMTCLDLPAAIREEWRLEHGIDGLDGEWPSDVSRIEADLEVAAARSFPPKDAAILRGAEALGWEARPIVRNAVGCDACGSCPFGCRRGEKRSGIRVHLARAHASGASIVDRARVTRILIEDGRAVGVEASAVVPDPATGEPIPLPGGGPGQVVTRRLEVRARQVVVSAGALRTPAVLLASGLDHPAIGRHLRLHPVPIAAGMYDEPVDIWRGTMQAARSRQFGDPAAGRLGYTIESAPGHPGLIALALPWDGAAEHARRMRDVRRFGPLVAVTRDGGSGRVSVTRAGRVRLDYRLDAVGVATLRHALVSMASLARAAGAGEILAVGTPPAWHDLRTASRGDAAWRRYLDRLGSFDFSPNRGGVFSAHQLGSARMGARPASAVCDPRGRVRWGVRADAPVGGLYVADGSLFPTGIGVNPMVSIMALALRVSRTILAESPRS